MVSGVVCFQLHSLMPSRHVCFSGSGSGFRSDGQSAVVGEQSDERRERATGAEGRSNR